MFDPRDPGPGLALVGGFLRRRMFERNGASPGAAESEFSPD